jgi:hypothetical protein
VRTLRAVAIAGAVLLGTGCSDSFHADPADMAAACGSFLPGCASPCPAYQTSGPPHGNCAEDGRRCCYFEQPCVICVNGTWRCGDGTSYCDPEVCVANGGSCTGPDMAAFVAVGNACGDSSDCGGFRALCRKTGPDGISWPGGYCTTWCDPARNQVEGFNVLCGPGAVCVREVDGGICETGCNAWQPCRDGGYECRNAGCEPSDLPDMALRD